MFVTIASSEFETLDITVVKIAISSLRLIYHRETLKILVFP